LIYKYINMKFSKTKLGNRVRYHNTLLNVI
jgi:hypothetical protein